MFAEEVGLSHSVVVPPGVALVALSGHIGTNPHDGRLPSDLKHEVILAFENIQASLEAAGVVDGWKCVYQVTTYTTALDEEWAGAMANARARFLGPNRPTWAAIPVPSLYLGARTEIVAWAYIPPSEASLKIKKQARS